MLPPTDHVLAVWVWEPVAVSPTTSWVTETLPAAPRLPPLIVRVVLPVPLIVPPTVRVPPDSL